MGNTLKATRLTPLGNMVLIKIIKVDSTKKTKSGLILSNGINQSDPSAGYADQLHALVIHAVGEKVDLANKPWKIGDKVIVNDYDLAKLPVEDPDDLANPQWWGLTKEENIWLVYE